MTRMLAMVTDGFGGRGGIARYNCDFLSALAGAGWQITVVPRYAPDPETPPCGVTQTPSHAGRPGYAVRVCFEALRARPQVVFCGHLFMAPLGLLVARLARARFVIQTHGIEAWQSPGALVRAACADAHLILSVSRYTRAQVLSWAELPPERVRVLPDTFGASFAPATASNGDNLGLDGKKVLLTVGRLDRHEAYKGHDRVIAALPDLVAGGHDVYYVVAGEGDDRLRLEALARHHAVMERVRFVGAVPKDRLVELYRRADLFVMPSTGEGFGIAFVEAMACGTPALGLGVGGAKDALGDGELGTLVAPNENLAARIAAQLNAPGLGGAPLSAAVKSRFGPGQFTQHARLLLERLVEDDVNGAVTEIERHDGR